MISPVRTGTLTAQRVAKIVISPEAASAGTKTAYSNLRTIHGAATAKPSRAKPARQRPMSGEES